MGFGLMHVFQLVMHNYWVVQRSQTLVQLLVGNRSDGRRSKHFYCGFQFNLLTIDDDK